MSRREQILSLFDPGGFGLEIGPSYNPLLPKSQGYRVETIDYTDQAGLRVKYASNPTVDVNRIEPVDHVSDGRPMRDVFGEGTQYDFIIASHVIEHTPDMLGFLKDCERLLKPDGVLVLAVPDKRCCFDIYQRLTSTGEVLEAHSIGRTRPGFGSIFDAVANGVVQDRATGWPKSSIGERTLVQTIRHAHEHATASVASGVYIDVHVWRFVPASFELILEDLFTLGKITLRIQRLESFDEMLVVLSRNTDRKPRDRLELLKASSTEQAYEHLAAIESDARSGRDALEADITALRQSLHDTEAEVRALRSSTSWRLTEPLRYLRKHLGFR